MPSQKYKKDIKNINLKTKINTSIYLSIINASHTREITYISLNLTPHRHDKPPFMNAGKTGPL